MGTAIPVNGYSGIALYRALATGVLAGFAVFSRAWSAKPASENHAEPRAACALSWPISYFSAATGGSR